MMFVRSFRGKFFLALVLLLTVLASVIVPVTQRDLIRTAASSERQAVNNIMEVIQHDVAGGWSSQMAQLMQQRRRTREQMLELSATIRAMVQTFADMAEDDEPGTRQAQALAAIQALELNAERDVFIYDAKLQILASNHPDIDTAALLRPPGLGNGLLAASMLDESRLRAQTVMSYVRRSAGGIDQTRSASFQHIAQWDWVLVVSGTPQTLMQQLAQQRHALETSMRQNLQQIRLTRSGFLFIIDPQGRLVTAPPEQRQNLVDALLADPEFAELRDPELKTGLKTGLTLDIDGRPWRVQIAALPPLDWTLVAAVPESDLTAAASVLLKRLALIFAAALLVALFIAWLIATRITRPLKTLTRYARDLPFKGLERAAPAAITSLARSHDEVGRLASSFIFMQHEVANNITRLMKETSLRERIDSELNIARDIQLGLLPGPLPADTAVKIDLCATMQAAKEVGGDLYDYFMLPDGRLCFAAGDVSDKGVPAALFMAVTHTLIRVCAEDETEPARMLQRINARLTENNPRLMFVTLLLGVLDMQSGDLTWSSAGHPPPALIGRLGVQLLHSRGGPACGVDPDARYQDFSFQLQPGETFFSYTDGVTDAVDPGGNRFGEARLLRTLAAGSMDCQARVLAVTDAVQHFMNGAEPFDDITLIALRRPERPCP